MLRFNKYVYISIIILFFYSFIYAKKVQNNDIKILEIDNIVNNRCNNLYIVESYEKDRHRTKLQVFKNNQLLKIIEKHSDGYTNYIYRYHYYFSNNELIEVKKHTYYFEDGVPANYDLNKSQHSIKTIYFENNKIKKIQIKGNPKVFTKEEEYNYIKQDLNEFISISKIFELPNYREYRGEKNGFFNEYPLSGKEKSLLLTYDFKNSPCEIVILDHKGNELYNSNKIITQEKVLKRIKVNSLFDKNKNKNYTGLKIYVDGSPGCKWWFKIEFEGEEVQIG